MSLLDVRLHHSMLVTILNKDTELVLVQVPSSIHEYSRKV